MPMCPYCDKRAKLVGGLDIYPHRPDLADKKFWRCTLCGAYTGCHAKGTKVGYKRSDGTLPLGILANAELRRARQEVHAIFDPLWQGTGTTRGQAYADMARVMKIPRESCHIAMFNLDMCNEAKKAVGQLLGYYKGTRP